jgi:RNA-directed DNA polymerase
MTTSASALAAASPDMVNGPEDDALDWNAISWRQVEDDVRRLRQRIFKASQAGDLKQVRNLQKLMLRNRSNVLLSVRQVTERNTGRRTAGIDGELALTATDKAGVADRVTGRRSRGIRCQCDGYIYRKATGSNARSEFR